MKHIENLIEKIKILDTEVVKYWDDNKNPETKVIEEQKIYIWIRVYLKEEDETIEIGDDFLIKYTPSGEELITKFVCYGKQGNMKDHADEIISYNREDDKKVLCLYVNEKIINTSEEIPFIRTLFKVGNHYEYQLVKRNELLFVNKRTDKNLDYFDVDW